MKDIMYMYSESSPVFRCSGRTLIMLYQTILRMYIVSASPNPRKGASSLTPSFRPSTSFGPIHTYLWRHLDPENTKYLHLSHGTTSQSIPKSPAASRHITVVTSKDGVRPTHNNPTYRQTFQKETLFSEHKHPISSNLTLPTPSL